MIAARDAEVVVVRGISLFNEHHFWDAHEAWEGLWLAAAGDDKQFLQGLIQLAAAYVHVQRGTFSGGVRLFDAAIARLAAAGPRRFGVDVSDVIPVARSHREKIARQESIDAREFPRLRYN